MSENKEQKLPIKIKNISRKSQGENLSQPCEEEENISSENSKPYKTVITTEISTNPRIVGEIPPWDDDEDSQQDEKSKPPTITAEILSEEENLHRLPRITGEIPPWDDEEEIKQ